MCGCFEKKYRGKRRNSGVKGSHIDKAEDDGAVGKEEGQAVCYKSAAFVVNQAAKFVGFCPALLLRLFAVFEKQPVLADEKNAGDDFPKQQDACVSDREISRVRPPSRIPRPLSSPRIKTAAAQTAIHPRQR